MSEILKPCSRAFHDAYGVDAEAYWRAAEMARECLGFTLEPGAEELRLMVGWFDRRSLAAAADERVKALERVAEAAKYIGTAHSAYCSTVGCNCSGHDKRRVELYDALTDLDNLTPKPGAQPAPEKP